MAERAMPTKTAGGEDRFRLAVECSPIAMILANGAGAIEMVNTAAESLFGYTRTELLGQSVEILIPEGLRVRHRNFRADFASAPQPRAMDLRHELYAQHKNGSLFPVQIGLNPLETIDGIAVLASITDLTARRQMEQMWRHFASIVGASEDAIVSKTMDGIVASWNPAAERIFGYPESEALGMPIAMLFPPDRLAEEADLMQRLARGEQIPRFDTVRVRKDGSLVDVSVTLSPIMDEFGNIVRASKIASDITERKRFEKDLWERTAVLQAFADWAPASIAMFDCEMRYLAASRQWRDELGLGERNLAGLSHYELSPNVPERHREIHRRCLAGAIERSEEDHFIREDGAEAWLRWEMRPWSYPDGVAGGIVIWTQDITASKKINDEMKRLALTDPLTNLPNRRLLMDRLKMAMTSSERTGKNGALLLVDVDHFKQVNDSLGHDAGDALLQQAANRLASSVRACDTVARFGGDEFVVVLEDLHEKSEIAREHTLQIGRKILAKFNKPFKLASRDHSCTVSIGTAFFGKQRQSEDELLKRADGALYLAKAEGRNTVNFA
jgi:diguanylate cyclase (GGDEF)-like protein/PAS domain S-box-containing protein